MTTRNPYASSAIVVPAVMLLLMITYLIMAIDMGTFFIGNKTSEAFFPLILGILGVPISGKILYDAIMKVKKEQADGRGETELSRIKTPVILTGISFLYIVAFHYIGLVPALLGYIFLFMTFFDDKIRHLLKKFLYSIVITGLIYVLYSLIFNIQFEKIFFF